MLRHTFDQDPNDHFRFGWSVAYKKWWCFFINVAYPAVVAYLKEQPKIADDFAVYVYGTVGDKYLEVMKGTGVIFSVFQTKLSFNRL